MDIRFAKTNDIPAILNLLQQIGLVHHRGRPDLFRARAQKYDAADLTALLSDENRPIFVAETDDRVVGYGFCVIQTVKDDPVREDMVSLYIDDLCVDESCRGQHVGTALYDHICRYARSRGCRSVTLNVWVFNENAMEFYNKRGLKPQKITMEAILEDE